VRKKLKNRLNQKNQKKKITEKPNYKKKLIELIIILKKPTGLVWFRFYKAETEKTKPNRKNRVKLEKTEPN
jgi:hypothetical protein